MPRKTKTAASAAAKTKKPAAAKKTAPKKTSPKEAAPAKKTPAPKAAAPAKGAGRGVGGGRPSLPEVSEKSLVAAILAKLVKSGETAETIAEKSGLRLLAVNRMLREDYHGTPVAYLHVVAAAFGKRLTITLK